MADLPGPLTLKEVFEAGVAFMGAASGLFKKIAPPDRPKLIALLGTALAAGTFLAAKLLLGFSDLTLTRNFWIASALITILAACICGVIYFRVQGARTIKYGDQVKLAGTEKEYLPDFQGKLQGRTLDKYLADSAGNVQEVWTIEGLDRSRWRLGITYTLFLFLLSFGLYLGIEAFNAPKPDTSLADKVAKLRDVHFAVNQSTLSGDAAQLLADDADILEEIFKDFPKATAIVEGYADVRGDVNYNFALAYQRAETAKRALIAAHVEKDKLTVASHGKEDDSCPSDDDLCHQKYRRVHLTVIQN